MPSPEARPGARPGLRLGALILAAGISRRFGSDKRQWRPGTERLPADLAATAPDATLLEATILRYRPVFETLLVVLRPEDAGWSANLPDCERVFAADAESGMGNSLASGIRAAIDLDGVFIALGDMPWVSPATLQGLAATLTDTQLIVRPMHGDTPGHPVGFGRAWFPALARLTGDQGANGLIRQHADLRLTPVQDPGVLRDQDALP